MRQHIDDDLPVADARVGCDLFMVRLSDLVAMRSWRSISRSACIASFIRNDYLFGQYIEVSRIAALLKGSAYVPSSPSAVRK